MSDRDTKPANVSANESHASWRAWSDAAQRAADIRAWGRGRGEAFAEMLQRLVGPGGRAQAAESLMRWAQEVLAEERKEPSHG